MVEFRRSAWAFADAAVHANFRVIGFALAIAVSLIIRLYLAELPGFRVDAHIFQVWAQSLASDHPWHFYDSTTSTDYAPGYLYVLWVIGELDKLLHFSNDQWEYVLKIPAIVADMASAYLIYRMLEKRGPGTQFGATLIYLFFPPALFIGAFWGQVDSILAFFLLLAVYFVSRDKPVAGAVALMIGILVKPQAVAALPFLAFWIVRQHPLKIRNGIPQIPRVWLECALIPLLLLLALIAPFFEYRPWRLIAVLNNATDTYRVNSFWAFNFWSTGGIFKMGLKCDLAGHCAGNEVATKFLGISTRYWGLAMFTAAVTTVLYVLRNARDTGFLALGTALCVMAFYIFLTRMHERYLFASFLPFLLACALLKSRVLWAAFVATAAVHIANLYYVIGYNYLFNDKENSAYPHYLRWPGLYDWLAGQHHIPVIGHPEAVQILSIIFVTAFVALLAHTYYLAHRLKTPERTM
jgi:dolichyl-phosphate-mannose-protein mannosyltransferase